MSAFNFITTSRLEQFVTIKFLTTNVYSSNEFSWRVLIDVQLRDCIQGGVKYTALPNCLDSDTWCWPNLREIW